MKYPNEPIYHALNPARADQDRDFLPKLEPKSARKAENTNKSPICHSPTIRPAKHTPNEQDHDTKSYWKPLSEVIYEYMEHPESKSEGDIGLLKRRYITIDDKSIHYIGKESNELDESQIIGVDDNNYTEYKSIDAYILILLSTKP